MTASYIVSAARTPIGSFRGSLATVPAPKLGAAAIAAAMQRAGIDPNDVNEVIMGNVLQAGVGQAPARQAALAAGLPSSVAAVTINKVCGSGLKAIMLADQAIRCGDAKIIVAGGMENMSLAPHLASGLRDGVRLGEYKMQDAMVHDGLTCAFEGCHMGLHAEHIAAAYEVTREDQDRYSLQSQQRVVAAINDSAFDAEITPVAVAQRKTTVEVNRDECYKPETTYQGLAALKPVFKSDGTVTAGNASTISDGAAAVVVMDHATLQHQLPKLANQAIVARIVASHTAGVPPRDLFIAPAFAISQLLERVRLTLDDIDWFEINEAFASQMVACCKKLNLDQERVNPLGGGVSLGHPIGASGARVIVTMLHAMARRNLKRGIASLCLGGGNAVAMLVERT
ncbi:MAG: acetyl-CoA C-acyltransferase [Planctomycetaceae bacterium]|nr:acetyl-CoA C-acyltransferase [Planctomycetaceae bacterium]